MNRDFERIAERVARGVAGMSQKEQKVQDVVDVAQEARRVIDKARKELLSVGRKVKYVDGVGNAALEAIMALEDADLKAKAVVDTGHRFLGR